MKKTLLLIIVFMTINLHSQTFWTSKSSTFSQVNRGIDDFSIVDDNVVWAQAFDGASNTPQNVREFTRSIDGGNTWTSGTINLGANQALLNISSIHALSATTAWATAYSDNGAVVLGGVWKTTDAGSTWVKQPTALFNDVVNSFANLVYFWNANVGFCQGDPVGGSFELYTTIDGGENWTRVPSANIPAPLEGEFGYTHNYDVVGNTIWFGTNKGRLFKSTNLGRNWTVSQTPISDFSGTTVSGSYSFRDGNTGLLVQSGTNPNLYQTTDGGVTWSSTSFSGTIGSRDIEYIPDTNVVVTVGTNPEGNSFTSYSIDNGANWKLEMVGTQVVTLKFKDAFLGFGGGFNISPTDGGIFTYSGAQLNRNNFQAAAKATLYPNPSRNIIQFSGADVTKVFIFDLLGKQVLAQDLPLGNKVVDVSTLNSAMYLVQAVDSNGGISTLKFIKN